MPPKSVPQYPLCLGGLRLFLGIEFSFERFALTLHIFCNSYAQTFCRPTAGAHPPRGWRSDTQLEPKRSQEDTNLKMNLDSAVGGSDWLGSAWCPPQTQLLYIA
jgi:hypothetical protein